MLCTKGIVWRKANKFACCILGENIYKADKWCNVKDCELITITEVKGLLYVEEHSFAVRIDAGCCGIKPASSIFIQNSDQLPLEMHNV